jgi:small conductance mechanosensitive channel
VSDNAPCAGPLWALPSFLLVLLTLLVVWVGWRLGDWLSRRAAIARLSARSPFLKELARTTTRWGSVYIAMLIALEIPDASAVVGAMPGTAGVIGIALGFAFRNTLENHLAGVLMSLRQPFAPCDPAVIDGLAPRAWRGGHRAGQRRRSRAGPHANGLPRSQQGNY